MFVVFGGAFIILARRYAMGSAGQMGPAYFPTVLGGILVVLGLVIFGRGFLSHLKDAGVPRLHLRPLCIILASVALFALLLRPAGLVIATFALIVLSAAGGAEFRFKQVLLLYFALVAGSVALFYYGLGLPFNLWPEP